MVRTTVATVFSISEGGGGGREETNAASAALSLHLLWPVGKNRYRPSQLLHSPSMGSGTNRQEGNADVAVVVSHMRGLSTRSFDAPKRWKKELDDYVGRTGDSQTTGVPTVLLANKVQRLPLKCHCTPLCSLGPPRAAPSRSRAVSVCIRASLCLLCLSISICALPPSAALPLLLAAPWLCHMCATESLLSRCQCDLMGDRACPTEALDKLQKESGFFQWHQCSAKEGTNVEGAITKLVEEIMRSQGVTAGASPYSVVKLGDGSAAAGGGCC